MFRLLVIAGVHGQEPQSSQLLEALTQTYDLKESLKDNELYDIYHSQTGNLDCLAIARFNVFGLENKIRGNKNKVDLNRNLPAQNWSKEFSNPEYFPGLEAGSEAENQKLVALIADFKPDLIISIHTNHFVTVAHSPQVNFDGELESQGYNLAAKLSELIDLELTCDIGYSTPGSLGSYAKDLKIPCITLELDDELDKEATIKRYLPAMNSFMQIL